MKRKPSFIAAFVAFVCLLPPASPAVASDAFDPKTAYGVVAGVLSWKDKSFASYPVKNRKDRELYETFLECGAARENFALLLDTAAVRDAVYDAVKRRAAAAPAGSTFVFYYAGHGVNRDNGGVFFAGYDMDRQRAEETGISPETVAGIIGQHFKGARVVFLADCCYSGALQAAAQMLNSPKLEAAALTSASASNTSAGSWTFTQTVIDALRGRRLLDRDGDGNITFGELSQEIAAAMRFRERQLSGGFLPEGLKDAAVAAATGRPAARDGAGAFAVGEYVSVPGKGGAKTARVLDIDGGGLIAEFYDYSDKTVSTVPAAGARKITFKTYPPGSELTVTWGNKHYAARVEKVEDGFHLITYPGWSRSWDEWVASDRVVEPGPKEKAAASAHEQVSVEWGGNCYPAVVLKKKGGRSFVHYTGYESSWDEWVGTERLNCGK